MDFLSNLKNQDKAKDFKNEVKSNQKKTLLITAELSKIDKYKSYSFDFYRNNEIISLFNYQHFLINVLLNIKEIYTDKYKEILIADEQYLKFYKIKKKHTGTKIERPEKITFLLPLEYYNLYYNLMHTFYMNEKSSLQNYSISIYFNEIVLFLDEHFNNLKNHTNEY